MVDLLGNGVLVSLRGEGRAGAKDHGAGPAYADLAEMDNSRDLIRHRLDLPNQCNFFP